MSKETLNAETFYKETINDKIDFNLATWQDWIHSPEFAVEFAEAYHKAKVNAITDEEIEKEAGIHSNIFGIRIVFSSGAKWFKNRLLNG